MKVVIIGAGNVATVLGRLIKHAGHEILQVVSRSATNAAILAEELGAAHSDTCGIMDTGADIYIVAVADSAFNGRNENFNLGDKIVVHTAGAISKDILKEYSTNYGVIYPLQSLRKEQVAEALTIPLLVDGSSEDTIQQIEAFAQTISSTVRRTNDQERLKLHVAAVLVSNFTNHLYSLAADYCSKEKLDFKMLMPLIEETATRLHDHLPADMQTGPAIRKDITTLDKHLKLLASQPKLYNIYLKLTDSIMNAGI